MATGPFILMFSRSLGVKNIRPKVLYPLHASAGRWHTICTISSFSSSHSRPSCLCVGLSLIIRAMRVVWPVTSPTAAISFSLLFAWSSFVQLDRGSLIRVLAWPQTLLVFHLFRCFCPRWLLMTSSLTAKGMSTVWSQETSCPFLGQCHFISVFFSFIPWCPVPILKWLLDPANFPSACILFLTRAGSVVVFAGAASAALLSGKICVLLLVTFSGKSSYVHLRTAITSTGNTVQRLPIGLLSLRLSLGPWTPAPRRLLIPDPPMYEMAT